MIYFSIEILKGQEEDDLLDLHRLRDFCTYSYKVGVDFG